MKRRRRLEPVPDPPQPEDRDALVVELRREWGQRDEIEASQARHPTSRGNP